MQAFQYVLAHFSATVTLALARCYCHPLWFVIYLFLNGAI